MTEKTKIQISDIMWKKSYFGFYLAIANIFAINGYQQIVNNFGSKVGNIFLYFMNY